MNKSKPLFSLKTMVFIITGVFCSCKVGAAKNKKYKSQLPAEYMRLKLEDTYDTTYVKRNELYPSVFETIVYYDSDSILVVEDWIFYGWKNFKKKKMFEYKGKKYMEYWYYNKNDELFEILYKMLTYDDENNPVGYVSFGTRKIGYNNENVLKNK